MKESAIREKSFNFVLKIVNLCKYLKTEKKAECIVSIINSKIIN